MTPKIKKIISALCLVGAVISALLLPEAGYCEKLRFVWLADSRTDNHGDPPSPEAMINTAVLKPIIAKIKTLQNPRPTFVVFGGDGAFRGHYADSDTNFYTYQTIKDLFKPLTDDGIHLYTAIGNHELYDTHAGKFILANQTEYQQVFKDNNPGNGPAGYERLVYSFTSTGGDAFFATLDPYYITGDIPDTNLDGNIDDTQLNWLAGQLAQTKATHKFLFIHTPYYYVNSDPAEPSSTPPPSFTMLWTILDNNRFDFYACGHSHLYSRKTIDRSVPPNAPPGPIWPPWKNSVVHLINGTCGAGPGTNTPFVDQSWHVLNSAGVYYFSVADIDDALLTVTSYGYDSNADTFSVVDTFTVYKGGWPGVNLLLLD